MKSTFFVAAAAALLGTAFADLDYSRTHIVDYHTLSSGVTNFLFRSNFPKVTTNGTSKFARQELTQYMAKRAAEQGLTLPNEFYFIDISFDNPLEPDFYLELEYFKKDPANANFTNWLLVGSLLPPQVRSHCICLGAIASME